MELPSEAGIDTEKYIGLLHKSLYGTRDAPANWEAAIRAVMLKIGFSQAVSNIVVFITTRNYN